jgi:hypothetical protein
MRKPHQNMLIFPGSPAFGPCSRAGARHRLTGKEARPQALFDLDVAGSPGEASWVAAAAVQSVSVAARPCWEVAWDTRLGSQ